jgi:hypothetical protein
VRGAGSGAGRAWGSAAAPGEAWRASRAGEGGRECRRWSVEASEGGIERREKSAEGRGKGRERRCWSVEGSESGHRAAREVRRGQGKGPRVPVLERRGQRKRHRGAPGEALGARKTAFSLNSGALRSANVASSGAERDLGVSGTAFSLDCGAPRAAKAASRAQGETRADPGRHLVSIVEPGDQRGSPQMRPASSGSNPLGQMVSSS